MKETMRSIKVVPWEDAMFHTGATFPFSFFLTACRQSCMDRYVEPRKGRNVDVHPDFLVDSS